MQTEFANAMKAAENESVVSQSLTRQTAEPNNINDKKYPITLDKFENFGHILLIGSTDVGKTTWMITTLLKGSKFDDYNQFVLIERGINAETLNNVRRAALYDMRISQKKQKNEKEFLYFRSSQYEDAVKHCTDDDKDMTKQVFWDDSQLGGAGNSAKLRAAEFMSEAKNAKCRFIVAIHDPTDGEASKKMRQAARYYVIFNGIERIFNLLMELSKGNEYWDKYNRILDPKDRVLIYDKLHKKMYNNNFQDFIPLINK